MATTWTIDPVHSSVEFSLDYMGFSTYRGSFCLLGPLAGYGIDTWGLPSVLSALGILFSIAFVCLLLPLLLRETTPTPEAAPRLP